MRVRLDHENIIYMWVILTMTFEAVLKAYLVPLLVLFECFRIQMDDDQTGVGLGGLEWFEEGRQVFLFLVVKRLATEVR